MLRSLLPTLRSVTSAVGTTEASLLTSRQRVLLRPLLIPTALGGLAVVVLAIWELASELSPPQVLGVGALVLAATLAEVFPVPIGRASVGGVSLAALFILGAGLLHGWAASAIVALCTSLIAQMLERKEMLRLVYNAAVYAIGGGLASLAMQAVGGHSSAEVLIVSAFVGSIVFWAVNIMLVIGAVSRVTRQRLGSLARSVTVEAAIPAAISWLPRPSCWSRSPSHPPYLPLTLVGPLAAITLFNGPFMTR